MPTQAEHLARILAIKDAEEACRRRYQDVKRIVLWGFTTQDSLSGECFVQFDNATQIERLCWSPDVTGRPSCGFDHVDGCTPIVASDLSGRITTALEAVVPAIRPLGRNAETGVVLTWLTPFAWRLPKRHVLQTAADRLTHPFFCIVINIEE